MDFRFAVAEEGALLLHANQDLSRLFALSTPFPSALPLRIVYTQSTPAPLHFHDYAQIVNAPSHTFVASTA